VKPPAAAPPHSLVSFAVARGVAPGLAKANLNEFAEKYAEAMGAATPRAGAYTRSLPSST